MLLILDGNSEHGAYIWVTSCISISWRNLVASKESSNPIFTLCVRTMFWATMLRCEYISLDNPGAFNNRQVYLYADGCNHATCIRWYLTTGCAQMKEDSFFFVEKDSICDCSVFKKKSLKRSTNKDCYLRAHLFLSYHLI